MSGLLHRIINEATEYFFYFSQSFYFSFGYFWCSNIRKARLCSCS